MKVKSIQVIGKRWFQRSYGNTYHSVKISINNNKWIRLPKQYGYGDQYITTAKNYLVKEGFLKEIGDNSMWRYCEENNIKLLTSVSDVKREIDL